MVCVFDADQTGRTVDETDTTAAGTEVVFSVVNDADSWIERAVVEEAAKPQGVGASAVYVATSDVALGTLARGQGAYVISSRSFVKEMEVAKELEGEVLKEAELAARWGGDKQVVNGIDMSTQEKLLAMYRVAPQTSTAAKYDTWGDFKRPPATRKYKKSASKSVGAAGNGSAEKEEEAVSDDFQAKLAAFEKEFKNN